MREAKLIVPLRDNADNGLAALHVALEQQLGESFGGFTVYLAEGVEWSRDEGLEQEGVAVYFIAMDADDKNERKLYRLARWVCRYADQDRVYVRYARGWVQFVTQGD